ncbi:MAG: NAD(P) transhydrogenase subunit alpha [Rhodospirillaceae bacterium]|jgi:H+-translocating NAD(P) transhydrogenase subunit alpha|nr:NAD(P) transhydrogenase subunit alpha [Rhodospirillaceae bacterium]MBT5245868.1 NAD(P) transhydrogenase subunit alpha [Rhodospirillaceae bacterium]MBT5561175.1 NAD(P) transhydrogenase subunit alpha [Rhodospirillaceae bacterium]MBT6242869.1 NAD(P) transhydrogenase subunit alpha [Rhodospirillaceae bacterium]MBT7136808.1 NAD(P) transhydrogenase subunit alpha [Rhodospirillaceae bacterium]
MDAATVADHSTRLASDAAKLAEDALRIATEATQLAATPTSGGGMEFLSLFTVFVLACFIGFYVVWSVTPALHSPLMAVTNAISSVIIVGGLLAAGPMDMDFSKVMGFMAVTLASVNIFGGFIVTQRMLAMFKKKKK